jgi:segregation and condensation protein A
MSEGEPLAGRGAAAPADEARTASAPPQGAGSGGDGVYVPEPGARVCEVSLEEFEGPLDLLLHLVRRHELDILDIPIAFVCEKYLEYIEFMQALDLEVAGDYLVMAATLAYLKSRELVPQKDVLVEEGGEDGEGGDPRQQLIMRLLEYQKYKEAADRLDARPMAGRDTFARGGVVELPPVDAGLAPITLFRLAEAYQRVLERARIHKSHEVVMETVSIAARMEQLTTLLIERSRFEFEALFLDRPWSSEAELRSMLVVTLMSVLELVRMGVASVHQPIGSDTILVERVASAEEAREALRGFDESQSFGDGRKPDDGPPADEEAAGDGEDDALDWQALLGGAVEDEAEDTEAQAQQASREDVLDDGVAARAESTDGEEALPDDARVTEPASPGDEASAAASVAAGGPAPDDAGAHARSVVSESPPSAGAVVDAGEVAPALTMDGASESTEGDGQEHGENGKAEAVEGS